MAKLVGILNITPDSFSDGGKYNNKDAALKHAQKLIDDEAAIIDIGAESTRPNATLISQKEEWDRLKDLLPAIIEKVHAAGKLVSVDTRHAKTAEEAIKLGVDIINDVSSCSDPKMPGVIKNSEAQLIINHNLGLPADPSNTLPENVDVINEIKNWARTKIKSLIDAGIDREQIIFDVGIGFGKNPKQSILILSNLDEFQDLEVPIFVGHSRKSFLNQFEPKTEMDKDSITAVFSAKIAEHCDYIRVHNVQLSKFMMKNFAA